MAYNDNNVAIGLAYCGSGGKLALSYDRNDHDPDFALADYGYGAGFVNNIICMTMSLFIVLCQWR